MTLQDLTDFMRRYNRFAAPGSECNAWQDYVQDCYTIYLVPPWHEEELEVSEPFAEHWLRVAAGQHEDYDPETGARR